MKRLQTIRASSIARDGLQIRVSTYDAAYVDELAELFDTDNPTWPDGLAPLLVFSTDGHVYYLADGNYRLDAAQQAGCEEVRVEVRPGGFKEAFLCACGVNETHGKRRTPEDRRNAVLACVERFPEMKQGEIADKCGLTRERVGQIIRQSKDNKEFSRGGNISTPGSCSSENISDCDSAETAPISPQSETRKKREAATPTVPAEPEFDAVYEEPDELVDALGVACQSKAATLAFSKLPLFAEALRHGREFARALNYIAQGPGGELLRANHLKLRRSGDKDVFYSSDLENAIRELLHWKPHTLCPYCLSKGHKLSQHDCTACKGLPYVTEDTFTRSPEKLRTQVIALKGDKDDEYGRAS